MITKQFFVSSQYLDGSIILCAGDCMYLCVDGLRKVWDIPRKLSSVWLTVYDMPDKERVQVEYLNGSFCKIEGRLMLVPYRIFDYVASFHKPIYVGCEYEE